MILPMSIIPSRRSGRSRTKLPPSIERLEERTLLAGNLQLLSIEAPNTVASGSGTTVNMTWVVENTGDEAINDPFWFDSVYLSDDEVLDETDHLLTFEVAQAQPLNPGETYSITSTFALGNHAGGDRFFLVAVDDDKQVTEEDEGDNVLSSPVNLTTPDVDLVIGTASASTSVVAGQTFFANWSVTNLGTERAVAPRTNRITLSTDDFLDLGDQVIFEEIQTTPIDGDASLNKHTLVTMPASLAPGTYYLFFETDVLNDQYETQEFNNGFAQPIEVLLTGSDLKIDSATVPSDWEAGSTVDVSLSLINQGTEAAAGTLSVAYYLSDDDQFDPDTDELFAVRDYSNLLPLGSATSVPINDQIDVSTTRLGNQFLLIVVDSGYEQAEEDESNNVAATAITITSPNVTLTNANAPSSADPGETIDVQWTVTNTGNASTTAAAWFDAVFLSTDDIWDIGDIALGEFEHTGNSLDPNGDYTNNAQVALPIDATGNYFLIFVTDRNNAQVESNESDNVFAVAIEISSPVTSDLVVTDFTAPTTVSVNQLVDVSWKVTNVGDAPLVGSWQDRLYLSTDPNLSEFDTLVQIEFINRPAGFAPNDSYTINQSVAIPDIAAGTYYLFVRTLATGAEDGDASNNVVMLGPISIGKPDLIVTQFDAPPEAVVGQTISVTYTVLNDSDVPMGASAIADRIVLSDDQTIDLNDQFLSVIFIQSDTVPLDAHGSYQRTVNVQLPANSTGAKYLILRTNTFIADQGETTRANNEQVRPISVTASDLVVESVVVPVSATFGTPFDVTYTVRNTGSGPTTQTQWYDRMAFTSQDASVSVIFSDILVTLDHALAPGESYTRTITANVDPIAASGLYRIGIATDIVDKQVETNENNNVLLSNLFNVTLPPVPDLVVTSIVAPVEGFSGQQFALTWTVTNIGNDVADGPWSDRVILSGPQIINLGGFQSLVSLAPGESITRTEIFAFPLVGGSYVISVKTDDGNSILEGPNESNTAFTSPLLVSTPPLPDLVITNIVAPPNGVFSGQTVPISFTVSNIGQTATQTPVWSDYVFVSSNPGIVYPDPVSDDLLIVDQPNITLLSRPNLTYLEPGESYTQTIDVTIPANAAGSWYLYVFPNGLGKVYTVPVTLRESDRTNNLTRSDAFQVNLSPPPDLVVSQVVAPSVTFSGQAATVQWTVTNTGPGDTTATSWLDRVFISADEELGVGDILLSTSTANTSFGHNGPLRAGESYVNSASLILPDGLTGTYYFFVVTDTGNIVFEAGAETNNVASRPTNVNLTPPPDLVVDSVTTAASALSGHSIDVTYTVTNRGNTDTPALSTLDRIYVSTDSQLDANDIQLAEVGGLSGVLEVDQSYTRTRSITLPVGIEGSYHIIVVANDNSVLFELDRDNNVLASDVVDVQTVLANLIVSNIDAESTAVAGQLTTLTWTVKNIGAEGTETALWLDKVFVTTTGSTSGGRLVGSFVHNGILASGESYTRTAAVLIPFDVEGPAHFYVVTDAVITPTDGSFSLPASAPYGRVYEGDFENDNTSLLEAVSILRDTPDLVLAELTASPTALSGQTINVSWVVQNIGGLTNADRWTDDVYLSLDQNISAEDIRLGSLFHSGDLAKNDSYLASLSVTLPEALTAGSYYIIVQADRTQPRNQSDPLVNRVYEGVVEANNIKSSPLQVTLSAVPDLAVSAVVVPATSVAGRTLDVSWTVTNGGASTGDRGWKDAVYLSRDQFLNPNADRFIGYKNQVGGLNAGEQYTAGGSFAIPGGLTGLYYVFVLTDASGDIFERTGEGNNTAYAPQAVDLLFGQPVDFVVGSIQVPATATPGAQATIAYTVNNNINLAVPGGWTDAIYLSQDEVWDSSDVLFGRVQRLSDLPAGASYTENFVATLPILAPGPYHVIIRTDVLNNVVETVDNNNIGVSLDVAAVDAIPLTLGVERQDLLLDGGFILYRVDASAGETLRFRWDALNNNSATEMFVRFGSPPTRAVFDVRSADPFAADPEIVLPETQAGTYFVLVRSNQSTSVGKMLVETVPFSVSNASPQEVGNAGVVTLEINGALFTRGTTFELVSSSGAIVQSTLSMVVGSTKAYASFDLRGKATGSYDLVARSTEGALATAEDAVEVVTATLGGVFSAGVSVPPFELANALDSFFITFSNTGQSDLIAPLLMIRSSTGTFFGRNEPAIGPGEEIVLYGASPDGPAGILRPGQSITIPFVFRAPPAGATNYSFELYNFDANDSTPINWQNVLDLMDPRVQAESDFNQIFAQLQSQIGTTMGQYVQMLSRNANLAPTLDDARNDGALLDIELQRAIAAVRTSLQGNVVTDDLDVVIADRKVFATNVDTGEVLITHTFRDGSFLFANIPSGLYEFTVEGALIAPGQFEIVEEGEHASGLELAVERGMRISGQVLNGLTPIEGASVSVASQDGSVLVTQTDSKGQFLLSGLVGGIYSISIDAEGYASFEQDGINVSSSDATTTAVLTKEGVIIGSVTLPPGGPTDTEMLVVATRSDNQVSVVSTLTSTYRLEGLLDGVYEIRIVRPGYVPVVLQNITVVAGQTQSLNSTSLVQAAVIRGQIITSDPTVSTSFLPVGAYVGDDLIGVVQADADGAYVFDELPAGSYDLRVAEVSLISDTVSVVSSINSDAVADIAVHSGATIFGVVRLESSQNPVPGVLVSLLLADGSLIQIETDSSGYYQFDRLGLGDYVVFLGSIGAGSFQSVNVTQIDGELIEADLSLASLAEVVGQITTSTGEPIADAFITVVLDGQTVAYTFSDESGNYRFLFFEAGIYEFRAFADNASFNPVTSVTLGTGSLAHIDFVAGESTLDIQATFAGQAAAGATATLTTESGIGVDVLFDENGFALVQNLVAGTYTLQVHYTAGAESTSTIILGQNQNQSVQVDLVTQSILKGKITGPGGVNAEGATIIIYAAGTHQAIAQTVSDANGEYQIQFLKPGTYDIIAYGSGLKYQLQTSVVINGQETLNLSLAASTNQVSVTVHDSSGLGVPFAFVTIRDAQGRVIDSAIANESGVALLTSAGGSNQSLQVSATGYSPSTPLPLDLSAPGATEIGTVSLSPIAIAATASMDEGLVGFYLRSEEVTFASFQASAQNSPWVKRLQDVRLERTLSWLKRLETLHFGDPVCPESFPLWKEAGVAVKQFRDSVTKATNLGKVAIENAKKYVEAAAHAGEVIQEAAKKLYAEANRLTIKVFNDNPGPSLPNQTGQAIVKAAKSIRVQSLSLYRAFSLLTSATSAEDAMKKVEAVEKISFAILDEIEKIPFDIRIKTSLDTSQTLIEIVLLGCRYTLEAAGKAEKEFNEASEKADQLGYSASDAVDRYIVFDLAHRNCNNNYTLGGGSNCGKGFGILAFRIDPNEITGPVGYGDPQFVSAADKLDYTIHFENLESASVPVQSLSITTQLDSNLDYRTIRFGSFGFRGLTFDVPSSQPFLNQRIDLTDTLGFFVDVVATIDVTTGLATWTLSAIDPATGEQPRDERIGFLPPNNSDRLGEGFVTYSVRSKSDVSTGDVIDAQATIIFDTELPLDTPTWSNTIDAVAPTSEVSALPAISALPTFILSWTANDAPGGSGLANTSIYVSENAGVYRLLIVADTTIHQYYFEGTVGSTYSFLSVAQDNAGNREKAPTSADAFTTIEALTPTLSIIGKADAIVGQPTSFEFAVTDFAVIPDLGYIIQVDWDNDGTFDSTVLGPSGTTTSHAFAHAGSQTIRAALFTLENLIVAETTTVIEVALSGVIPNPEHEGIADLVWGGTTGDDRYRFVELDPTTISVEILSLDDEVLSTVDFFGVTGSVRVYALAGNDFVDGSALVTKSLHVDLGDDNDTVLGGKADDFLDADGAEGHGNDVIDGGDGNDTISADGPEGYDPTDTTGQDTIRGGSGNDVIEADGAEGSNDDYIEGGSGDDVIHADGAEAFRENGTYGKDTVSGGEGDDLIVGDGAEGADDQITGDDGNDVIIGGEGADELDGGIGSDLVLAGSVTDLDAASLILVHAEWKSTRSLATRLDNLLGTGTGDRENEDIFLTPAHTKLTDHAIDTVLGGEDDDWLLADLSEDELLDYDPLEDILSS